MARTKAKATTNSATNSMSELIAVAELKEIILGIDAKLDLLLNSKTTPAQEALAATTTVTPIVRGPSDWTEEELKEWIGGLDGLTRANIECGAINPQEVWKSMKAEGW